ncbi:Oct1p [Sugiyamaella lignohabitans]|uniref:Mitochondrial intermediate peptidase n=1 Tax=Sugiyamaella lignohabitans TaxID=796027 RepID=A0A167CTG1_9ASCO|nr:Oct1p [Sugiyamaella lignohabitans]ANB12086.1 Oct1p [Sugiyamaella lignohabitans]
MLRSWSSARKTLPRWSGGLGHGESVLVRRISGLTGPVGPVGPVGVVETRLEARSGKPFLNGGFVLGNRLRRVDGSRQLTTKSTTGLENSTDQSIRDVFDSVEFWKKDFAPGHTNALEPTGLFENRYLTTPQGMVEFTQESLRQAQELTLKIINAGDDPEALHNAIRNFDILSDIICKVIDMVAFVRISHPNKEFINVAQECHELMYDYMNMLNTSVELHDILDKVLGNNDIRNGLSSEEITVGEILLADFKKSGVNLAPHDREKFVRLSSKVSILGQQFLNNIGPAKHHLTFSKSQVWGLDPVLANRLRSFGGRFKIPTYGPVADMALQTISNENTRRDIWLAQRSATDEQVGLLGDFLTARAELARMMGCNSFAEYELKDKMAKTPVNVQRFLDELAQQTNPRAAKELLDLKKLKSDEKATPLAETLLKAWDRDYYAAKHTHSKRSKSKSSDFISAYFSLGTVMQGLSRLFTRIYGISFVPIETKPGEVWDDEVRRLDVVSETEGKIGVIYCDLFQRDGKSPHPAHFTVQCSREITPGEPSYYHQGSSVIRDSTNRCYQLPIIALVCDFVKDPALSKCLLSYSEVQTLFHEMGHAIHSMLGRTSLHNVSGTRCATDFVELPSVLMERFAASPEVMKLFARHHLTDEPLPLSVFNCQLSLQSLYDQTETYHQILISMLDQQVHSELANTPTFDPNAIYYELEKSRGLFEAHPDSRWPAQFGHLFSYGANYYCYLFDRAIADRIWQKLFVNDPTSREAGEHFRREVLSWGGSRDPWQCVSAVLREPSLANGDETAMLEIGRSLKA